MFDFESFIIRIIFLFHSGEDSVCERDQSRLVFRTGDWFNGLKSFFTVGSCQRPGLLESVAVEDSLEGGLNVTRLREPPGDHGLKLRMLCTGKQNGCCGKT